MACLVMHPLIIVGLSNNGGINTDITYYPAESEVLECLTLTHPARLIWSLLVDLGYRLSSVVASTTKTLVC